jgi:hypothetical protein
MEPRRRGAATSHVTLLVMEEAFVYPPTAVSERLTARGLQDVADWDTGFPNQVTGRIPPEGKWFYFREDAGAASIEIYPAGRYPFAPAGSKATAGWDAMSLGEEPAVEWSCALARPQVRRIVGPGKAIRGPDCDIVALTETLVFWFIERWRSGGPENTADV